MSMISRLFFVWLVVVFSAGTAKSEEEQKPPYGTIVKNGLASLSAYLMSPSVRIPAVDALIDSLWQDNVFDEACQTCIDKKPVFNDQVRAYAKSVGKAKARRFFHDLKDLQAIVVYIHVIENAVASGWPPRPLGANNCHVEFVSKSGIPLQRWQLPLDRASAVESIIAAREDIDADKAKQRSFNIALLRVFNTPEQGDAYMSSVDACSGDAKTQAKLATLFDECAGHQAKFIRQNCQGAAGFDAGNCVMNAQAARLICLVKNGVNPETDAGAIRGKGDALAWCMLKDGKCNDDCDGENSNGPSYTACKRACVSEVQVCTTKSRVFSNQ